MRTYRRLLRLPGVRRQVLVASVSRMTPPLLTLPLLVGVNEAYRSHALAGLMVGVYTATFAVMMPVTGRLVDRWGGRLVLRIWLGLALVALLGAAAALAARPPVPILVVSVVALGASLPPVGSVTRAGWPLLVPAEQLRAAYALDSLVNEAATVSGPLLAALALTIVSPPTALLVAAVAIVVGSLGLPLAVLVRVPGPADRPRTARPSSVLLCLYGIALCGAVGAGCVVATAGLLAADQQVPGLAGLLLTLVALGAVAAGAVAGSREISPGVLPKRIAGYSAGLAGVFVVLSVGLDRSVVIGVAGLYLAFGCLTGPRDALLQLNLVQQAPAAQRTGAFSWLAMSGLLGLGLGSAASGASAAAFDSPFLPGAVAAVAGVVLGLVLVRLHSAERGRQSLSRR